MGRSLSRMNKRTLALLAIFALPVLAFNHSEKRDNRLDIPTAKYIEQEGYPVNENGETYGPQIKSILESPDLILTENAEGIKGYIRAAEIDYTPQTPDEAGTISKSCYEQYYNMYLQDGKTVVGQFWVTAPNLIIENGACYK